MNQKIRCAIVGLGGQALEHIQASIDHPEIEIIVGIDPKAEREIEISKQFPTLDLTVYKDLQ